MTGQIQSETTFGVASNLASEDKNSSTAVVAAIRRMAQACCLQDRLQLSSFLVEELAVRDGFSIGRQFG